MKFASGFAALVGILSLCAPAMAQQVPNPMSSDNSNAKLPQARDNLGLGGTFSPAADHGAATDGTTDVSPAIAASLADCAAAGGGQVEVGNYPMRLAASITVPFNCALRGSFWPGNLGDTAPNLNRLPRLMLDSTASITVQGTLENLAIYRFGITAPTSARTAYDGAQAFAGTAIKVASRGVTLNQLLIVGFDKCVDGSGGTNNARLRATYIYGDCQTGFLAHHFHDVVAIHDIEFWPFYSGPGFRAADYIPTAVANNGSGAIRLTIPTHVLRTGDRVQITGATGFGGINAAWTATVVDTTHIDLQGAQFAPETTGTFELGSRWVRVASTNSLGIGQTVAGAGIPVGAAIQDIDWSQKVIWLSTAGATAAGTDVPLTFTNTAFAGIGKVRLDSAYRSGMGFEILDSEGIVMRNVFSFGHKIGYHVGAGARDIELIYAQCDGGGSVNDTLCMWVTDNATVDWDGGWVSSYVNQIFLDGYELVMRGVRLVGGFTGDLNGAVFASVNNGNLTVSSNRSTIGTVYPMFISDSNPVSHITLDAGKYGDLKIIPKNDIARGRLCVSSGAQIWSTAFRGTACGAPISWSSASQTVSGYIAPGSMTAATPDFGWYNGTGRLATLSGIHIDQVTAPGAGKSWTYTVKAGELGGLGGTGATCTISDAATSCDGVGTQDLAAGQYFAIQAVPTGGPAATGWVSASVNLN